MSKQLVMKFMLQLHIRAEMRTTMGALDLQAETWTSHHGILMNEMTGVAGDALEKPEKKVAQ